MTVAEPRTGPRRVRRRQPPDGGSARRWSSPLASSRSCSWSCRSSDCWSVRRGHWLLRGPRPGGSRSMRCACRWSARWRHRGLGWSLGVPLAWVLARGFPGRAWCAAWCRCPWSCPRRRRRRPARRVRPAGVRRPWLDDGVRDQLPSPRPASILAETFVALPFFVITVEGALRGMSTAATRTWRRRWGRPDGPPSGG